jgi:hypothetical protein
MKSQPAKGLIMKSLNADNVVGASPKYWRNRAEEARVAADSMQDEQSKQLMFGVANEYERVAELTEKRLKRSAIAGKRGASASFSLPLQPAAGWVHPGIYPSYPPE